MKVLLDLSVLSAPNLSRGIGRYVTSLARALHMRATQDSELSVVATYERPWFRTPRVTDEIPALLDEMSLLRSRGGVRRVGGASALNRAIVASGADVVHALDPYAMPGASLKCPRVVTCHHLESTVGAEKWHGADARFSRAERSRYGGADRVVAMSRATAQELIARLDVPRERISVVYNGVSERVWGVQPAADDEVQRQALGAVRGGYFLCVGAVDERKNVEGMLRGLARARELLGSERLQVIWAGRHSTRERARLMALARQVGLSTAVKPVGYVSDGALAALYRGASALVFASKREGFGYPVVEAMACSCPVITSNCSSLVEVAGDAALTVDPDDAEAIADAIVLLSDDNAEGRALGEKGRARAARYTLANMVEGTILAYRGALSGAPAAPPSHPPPASVG